MGRVTTKAALKPRDLVAGVLAVAMLSVMFAGTDTRTPFVSSETNFVEHSTSGLQIVPASCESTPPYEHSAGECTPPASGRSCTLSATPSAIQPGQSATLAWSIGTDSWSTVQSRSLSPNAGTISGNSGSMQVSPTQATTYTLSVTYAIQFLGMQFNPETITCSASISIDGDGTQCPTGQTWNGTQCVDGDGGDGDSCPIGYTMQGGSCTYTGCPSGYVLQGGQCVQQETQCTPMYFCAGPDINGDGIGDEVWQRNAQCQESSANQNCVYGCSGGGCLPPPAGEGNITAQPSLVRSGERSTITWTTSGMEANSCTVTENNPEISDSRSGQNSGTLQTSQIRQQTAYMLRCTSLDGEIFTDSVTVNILPIFQEQ